MLSDAQGAVLEFHKAFGLDAPDRPTTLDQAQVNHRIKWMQEELREFAEAETLTQQADAIADLIYFALGAFVEMGVDGSRVFEVVHEANMKKLNHENRASLNDEGKVIKPPFWASPNDNIEQLLLRYEEADQSKKSR